MIRRPPRSTLFPYTTLFRSRQKRDVVLGRDVLRQAVGDVDVLVAVQIEIGQERAPAPVGPGHAGHLADVRERAVAVVEMKRSEEHTSELQSRLHLVCRLLLEKKKKGNARVHSPAG